MNQKIIEFAAKRNANKIIQSAGLECPSEYRFELESEFIKEAIKICLRASTPPDSALDVDATDDEKISWCSTNIINAICAETEFWVIFFWRTYLGQN